MKGDGDSVRTTVEQIHAEPHAAALILARYAGPEEEAHADQ